MLREHGYRVVEPEVAEVVVVQVLGGVRISGLSRMDTDYDRLSKFIPGAVAPAASCLCCS